MVAFGVKHATAKFVRVLELRIRGGQLVEHLRREAVALFGSIDADHEQVAPLLRANLAVGIAFCAHGLCASGSSSWCRCSGASQAEISSPKPLDLACARPRRRRDPAAGAPAACLRRRWRSPRPRPSPGRLAACRGSAPSCPAAARPAYRRTPASACARATKSLPRNSSGNHRARRLSRECRRAQARRRAPHSVPRRRTCLRCTAPYPRYPGCPPSTRN